MGSADTGDRRPAAVAVLLLAVLTGPAETAVPRSEPLTLVHRQRYAMGTMVDVLVYHDRAGEAARAAEAALEEFERLDRVMSHFREDSALSALVREARTGAVHVHRDLYGVIRLALEISARSGGGFDVTAAPLARAWKQAGNERRSPTPQEIAGAMRCVGYGKIELQSPDRIRLNSPCLELDLSAIGKGYAVDRAIAVLASAGIRHALVNAGGSSIAAIGHPPEMRGWPVAAAAGERPVLLSGASIATSEQAPAPALTAAGVAPIVEPRTGGRGAHPGRVLVRAPSAALSDALSTALIVLPRDRAVQMLQGIQGVAAVWFSPDGRMEFTWRQPLLPFAETAR
jgi:thiamine biosynthesis lipoprotein